MRGLQLFLIVPCMVSLATGCGDDGDDGSGGSDSSGGAGVEGGGGAGGSLGGGGVGAGGGSGGAGGAGGATPIVCDDPDALGVMLTPPALLSETGLYDDIAGAVLASDIESFTPAYELWSDGATKQRFVYLPDCVIDTSDMDHWSFPIGTRLWKEFRVGGELVETRLIHRYGTGADDFIYAAYQWALDGSDATHIPNGIPDANGTGHDIPGEDDCFSCHQGLPEHVLGFGAIQLSHSGAGLTITGLSAAGRLSNAAPGNFTVPGDEIEAAALGTLHANCGGCHNPQLSLFTSFSMRLSVEHTSVQDTHAFTQAVDVVPNAFFGPTVTHRIAAGDPSASAVSFRMGVRQEFVQMPPLGTEVVNDVGLGAVDAWIVALGN